MSSRLRFLGLFLLLAPLGMACSAAADDPPRATSDDFENSGFSGEFALEELVIDGASIPLMGQPTILIDPEAASIALDTVCNTQLGSYSFFGDGQLSVTLTGGTTDDCTPEARAQDSLLSRTLGAVATWQSPSQSSEQFQLSTAEADSLTIVAQGRR